MKNFNWMKNCLCCDSTDLKEYLDLGPQPLANSYHAADEILPEFPLQIQFCKKCYHSQLTASVNPDLLYKHYLYVSGTSGTLIKYFRDFVHKVGNDFALSTAAGRKVLDIASNDGSLLKEFKNAGWDVQGVDPAENLRAISEKNGIPTKVAYWGKQTAAGLDEKYDVIVAQNVLAHLPYPLEFIEACKSVLKDEGKIYIQTSQADMFLKNEFDTIYHEHHSFFSALSMKTLVERAGLYVSSAYKAPIHGTSYVFVITKELGDPSIISSLIEAERNEGRYSDSMYSAFTENSKKVTSDLLNAVVSLKSDGMKVVGFGAAAKGMTVLNFGKIKLDYIVDDNPMKCGLLTPGMNIVIKGPDSIEDESAPVGFVILAWNFFDEIKSKISQRRNNPKDKFIRYFPNLNITQ